MECGKGDVDQLFAPIPYVEELEELYASYQTGSENVTFVA